jgi:phosphate-selective porin OprO/OprP
MIKRLKNTSKAMLIALLGLGIASGSAVAGEFTADECLLHTKGGLMVKYAKDPSYWMAIGGMAGYDYAHFMGNYRDKAVDPASGSNPIPGVFRNPNRAFPSGSNIRGIILGVAGGIGPHWSYVLSIIATGRRVLLDDTYLSYSPLHICEKLKFSVGNVPGQFFGFDSSNSLSWTPFIERNLAAITFFPGQGLGVMGQYGWCDGSLLITAFQPGPYENAFDAQMFENSVFVPASRLPIKRDYWTSTARLTYSPLHNECDVYHFGLSAMWQEQPSTIQEVPIFTKRFIGGYPGVRGRSTFGGLAYTTARLVDTGFLRVNYVRQFNVEAARQWGPVIINGEYTDVYAHRVGDPLGALNFNGWNMQARYMLTGERLGYDVDSGNFCSIVPDCVYGAVELAARYDYVNLNSKNVIGGSEHNVTVGINWFINQNVRLTLNYIRADIHPGTALALAENRVPNTVERKLDIIAFRAGVRF